MDNKSEKPLYNEGGNTKEDGERRIAHKQMVDSAESSYQEGLRNSDSKPIKNTDALSEHKNQDQEKKKNSDDISAKNKMKNDAKNRPKKDDRPVFVMAFRP